MNYKDYIIISISAISLIVSLLTAWFALRRGTLQSTRPSYVAVRYDFVGKTHPQAKIFLRNLLFSTGKRGVVIESLFLRVNDGTRTEEFSYWGYGDKDLVRGSGLFVGENGVVTNHHFNPISSEALYLFKGGDYDLELVAKLVNRDQLLSLSKVTITIPKDVFDSGISPDAVVDFNWSPEEKLYITSKVNRSALDVAGIDLNISTQEIIATIREGRKR